MARIHTLPTIALLAFGACASESGVNSQVDNQQQATTIPAGSERADLVLDRVP